MKPLCFIDVESTGLDVARDRIIQVGAVKLYPDNTVVELVRLVNPERPIPPEVVALTGITDEQVRGAAPFSVAASQFDLFFLECDLVGFNIHGFDLPILVEEFLRAGLDFAPSGVVIDLGVIFKKKEERTLGAALKFYCGGEHRAHDALHDARAMVGVYGGQMGRYPDLGALDRDALAAFSRHSDLGMVDFAGKLVRDKDGDVVYNFGQRTKGVKVKDDVGFANWILDRDFPLDTKRKLQKELDRLAGGYELFGGAGAEGDVPF